MSDCKECGGLLSEFPLGNCTNPHVETPTDKSPPREFYWDGGMIIELATNENSDLDWEWHLIEHSAYLAVKEELDDAKIKAMEYFDARNDLKQELDAARAEIEAYRACEFTWAQTRRTEIMVRQQLADAQAQIEDYESALEWYAQANYGDIVEDEIDRARNVLNKWKAK